MKMFTFSHTLFMQQATVACSIDAKYTPLPPTPTPAPGRCAESVLPAAMMRLLDGGFAERFF